MQHETKQVYASCWFGLVNLLSAMHGMNSKISVTFSVFLSLFCTRMNTNMKTDFYIFKTQLFGDVTHCRLTNCYRRLGGEYLIINSRHDSR